MLVSKLSFVSMITKFQTYTALVPGKLITGSITMFYLSWKIFNIVLTYMCMTAAEGTVFTIAKFMTYPFEEVFVKNSESEELFHINFTLKILLYYLKNIHHWWHFCFLSFAGDYFNSNICDRIHHTTMGSRLSQCLCRNKRKIMVCCKAIFYYRCVTEVNIICHVVGRFV